MSRAEHIQKFEKALSSPEPKEELYRLAVSLREEGVAQIELFFLFERFQLLNEEDDRKFDAILDNMDLIAGGPWAKGFDLYPHELTEHEINEHRNTV